ncbi:RNA-binding region RNP-1 domain-containing protein [Cavenderia fasciculata]|uniref:RNA-binding region RNP-1 domain-containing protein n=1 Tax=Cavenderia fasciculata TaxID=261658 RepID=F4Q7I0_CACFS|nr:RNA-binding region RNP-1 domain-containing protein [Cavenderia fasciculata]EGG16362.1 RNA-binding region RNP-1 domain-containing protein [Cavenderia fasciculata]|eukprot:XP_004354746.1 RNA-binding region RNP-1 domain-containing protein [Cavenderia fasciculata]
MIKALNIYKEGRKEKQAGDHLLNYIYPIYQINQTAQQSFPLQLSFILPYIYHLFISTSHHIIYINDMSTPTTTTDNNIKTPKMVKTETESDEEDVNTSVEEEDDQDQEQEQVVLEEVKTELLSSDQPQQQQQKISSPSPFSTSPITTTSTTSTTTTTTSTSTAATDFNEVLRKDPLLASTMTPGSSTKTSPSTAPVQQAQRIPPPHEDDNIGDLDHNNELNLKRSLETNEDFEQSKAKKLKNTTPQPSKVIHLRNLPIDCTEHEIMAIAAPFGQVDHILILKGKSQGFIQFLELTSASSFIQFYTTIQGCIRAKNFFVQYSNREEITSTSAVETPNNILLVTISNIVYPVTIEVLYQLFGKYGSVLKILIFSKSGNFQSLVQLHSLESAIQAKRELDGQSIYSGCCTMKIQYSSLSNLRIKYNNDKSRDFTNPTLMSGIPSTIGFGNNSAGQLMSQQHAAAAAAIVNQGAISNPHLVNPATNMGVGPSSAAAAAVAQSLGMTGLQPQAMATLFPHISTPVLIVGGLPLSASPQDLFNLFGVYGDPIRIKIMFNKKDTALIQMNLPQQAELALQYLNNVPFRGSILRVNLSRHASISMPKSGDAQSDFTKDYTGSASHRFKQPGSKNYQNIHPPSMFLLSSSSSSIFIYYHRRFVEL